MRAALILLALFSLNAYAGDPACAKGYITLHKTPGGPVSWKVARYMPFLKLENKGAWVKVQDFEGETHWAKHQDLTSSIFCVVVKSQVATLRQNPAANAPPSDMKTVDKYTPLKKIEVNGEWVHVEDETGRQAWIHESTVWKPMKIQSVTF